MKESSSKLCESKWEFDHDAAQGTITLLGSSRAEGVGFSDSLQ